MFLFALSLCYAAWCLLRLGMDKHHRQAFDAAPTARRRLALRACGWCVLVLAFALCVTALGWEFGPVAWGAALIVTAIALVLLLPYAPRWALRAAGSAPALALLALLASL